MPEERRSRRVAVIALGAILVVAAGVAAGLSGALSVRQIEVTGVGLVTEDQVLQASGVSIGQSMVFLSQAKIAQRITVTLAEVESVTVDRLWPDRVALQVTERTPVFQVAVDDQFALVSADGTVFHIGGREPSLLLGQVDPGGRKLLADVATVVVSLPPTLVPEIRYVSAPTRDSITLSLQDDRQVIWGSSEQSELKGEVLMSLLSVPGSVYDVSAPSAPAVR